MGEFIKEYLGFIFLAAVWLSLIGVVIRVKISEFLEKKEKKKGGDKNGRTNCLN